MIARNGGKRERVVLVDGRDRRIGTAERLSAHRDGRLHRAVSVFIVNDASEILLQRRSRTKDVAGGLWSNACCTHPRPGERTAAAARRRLYEEMRLTCHLRRSFAFTYRVEFDDGWVEHEYDHVFVGRCDESPNPRRSEVDDWRWVHVAHLRRDVRRRPHRYTPWFRIALPTVLAAIA